MKHAWIMGLALLAWPIGSGGLQRGVVTIEDQQGTPISLYRESHALLVGVSDYTAGWPDLESVPRELDQVKKILETQGFQVVTVFDPDAGQLEHAFQNFINDYGYQRGNRLLFFFSGHGHTWEEGGHGYLVPSDAPRPKTEKGNPGPEFLRKALFMSDILAWSKQMTVNHALFLFDSCFSGAVFKEKSLPSQPPHLTQGIARPVREFITAGSAGETVPARSVFTPAFVDALKYAEGDLNKDGYVTGIELGLHLHQTVPQHARQSPQFGKHPEYRLSRGDFVFKVGGSLDEDELTALGQPGAARGMQVPQGQSATWTEPVTGMEFVWIPKGCFEMGSPKIEESRHGSERQHRECVEGFWLGKHEVSNAQFRHFLRDHDSGEDQGRSLNGDDQPAVKVDWYTATDFASWLSKRKGEYFRLPTEAEWEYAARAGTETARYWGDDIGTDKACAYANVHDKTSRGLWSHTNHDCDDGYTVTAPVGRFLSNPFGLHDMLGNVWEWTCSYVGGAEKECVSEGSDFHPVIRGGAWDSGPQAVRSAYSGHTIPRTRHQEIGFRLVRTP